MAIWSDVGSCIPLDYTLPGLRCSITCLSTGPDKAGLMLIRKIALLLPYAPFGRLTISLCDAPGTRHSLCLRHDFESDKLFLALRLRRLRHALLRLSS